MDEITPEMIAVLRLAPGDIVVYRHPDLLSDYAKHHIVAAMERQFPGHQYVVIDGGASLDVVRPGGVEGETHG